MKKYRRILSYALKQWPHLLLIVVATFMLSSMTVLQPWPLKLLIDYALSGANLPSTAILVLEKISIDVSPIIIIIVAAIASMVVYLLGAAMESSLTWFWGTLNQRMTYNLASDLFRRFHQLSLLFHNRHTIGDLLNRVTTDARCVYKVVNNGVISPIQDVFILTTIAVVSWRLDPALTTIALGGVPLMTTTSYFFGRWIKRNARRQQKTKSRLMAFVQQNFAAIPLIQAFQAEDRSRSLFSKIAKDNITLLKEKLVLDQAISAINGSVTTFIVATILFIGGQKVLSGTLTLGSLVVFVAYIRTINASTRSLLSTYVNLKAVDASIDRVFEIMDAKEEISDLPSAYPLPDLYACQRGSLVFDHIIFGYERRRTILHDIDLKISAGETVALVGPTGAGKSTLVSLVPRFYDPWAGRVLLDGHDIRNLEIKSLRSQIAMVLQDPFILPLSIAENICYGRPEATDEEIIAAAVKANAHEFIRCLPQGYHTILGDAGGTLSGGQRQRLSIARALLKDAPILILDEPTSTLDLETEQEVLQALEHLKSGRTTLIIAHRLSTIRSANRIAVMEDGKIVEIGSHKELVANAGLYQKLYTLQLVQGNEGVLA